MTNYSFWSLGMHRKQNFKIQVVFGFKSFPAPSSFTFCFPSSPLLSHFFPQFFSCWAFTKLPFGGKRFSKKPRGSSNFLKKVCVGSGTRFSLEFSVQSFMVFWESHSFGYGWKISSSCISLLSKLSRTVNTDDVTSGTRYVVKQLQLQVVQRWMC